MSTTINLWSFPDLDRYIVIMPSMIDGQPIVREVSR